MFPIEERDQAQQYSHVCVRKFVNFQVGRLLVDLRGNHKHNTQCLHAQCNAFAKM